MAELSNLEDMGAQRYLTFLGRQHLSWLAVPVYNSKQIEGIRRACVLGREVLDKAHAAVRPGVTTDEIDRVVGLVRWPAASVVFLSAVGFSTQPLGRLTGGRL